MPGKRDPTWNKTLSLVFGRICKLFLKTEWPCLRQIRLDTAELTALLAALPSTTVLPMLQAAQQRWLDEQLLTIVLDDAPGAAPEDVAQSGWAPQGEDERMALP